jgi:hypothetical protein
MMMVILTNENSGKNLFTRCTFDNSQGKRSKGVLLAIKSVDDKIWLLFRHIHMSKTSLTNWVEWVPLHNDKIVAEIFAGFVSIEYLSQLDNRAK